MFCPNCGAKCDVGLFCPNCGARLNVQEQHQPQMQPQPQYQPQSMYTQPTPSVSPVMAAVKSLLASPLALVSIIAITVGNLMSVISYFASIGYIKLLLPTMFQSMYMDLPVSMWDIYEYIDLLTAFMSIGVIIALIPSILSITGMWITYGSAASKKKTAVTTAGITMVKIVMILNIVGYALLFIFMLIIAIAMTAEFGLLVGAIVLIIYILALIVPVLYTCFTMATLNTVSRTIKTGAASDKVSGFVAVMCFIYGGVNALGVLLTGITGVCLGAYFICYGILLFKYKSKMRELMAAGF